MDREEQEKEMHSHRLFVFLYEEASKIKLSWRKIFTQITLTLILPLLFIFLTHIEVSNLFFKKFLYNSKDTFTNPNFIYHYVKLSKIMSFELITILTFQMAYFTFLLITSLLSTLTVTYTVASIYTPEDVTFKRVKSFFSIVWKRLVMVFLFALGFFSLYNFGSMIVICLWENAFGLMSDVGVVFDFMGVVYFIGIVHFTVVGQLDVMIDLDESWEILVMEKNYDLLRGKMTFLIFMFFTQMISFISIMVSSNVKAAVAMAVVENEIPTADKMALVLSLLLLCCLFLFGLVLHGVIFYVSKSYHHENVDIEEDHDEVYGGEYVQLKANDFDQMEQVCFII